MAKLIFLGTSNAIPDERHDNTHLAILAEKRTILIDCGNNPIIKLKKVSINPCDLTDLVLTHMHPDHVGSVPLLLMDSWLMGRTKPLMVHGLDFTLDRIKKMMDLYNWGAWPDFFPLNFHAVPQCEMALVLETPELQIHASPAHHIVPSIALRFDFLKTSKAVAFSCDTEPCIEVVNLGRNADILIHEATGESYGHSSAFQAGEIAQKANVQSLYLIHYPTGDFNPNSLIDEARLNYNGPINLAEDFMELEF